VIWRRGGEWGGDPAPLLFSFSFPGVTFTVAAAINGARSPWVRVQGGGQPAEWCRARHLDCGVRGSVQACPGWWTSCLPAAIGYRSADA